MNNKKVFVTGGCGYIGAVLIPKLLKRGYEVTVVDLMIFGENVLSPHPSLKIIKGDIRNRQMLESHLKKQDAVIHLAFISNDPEYELEPEVGKSINLAAFQPLVELTIEAGVRRFIFASSCSVYGKTNEKTLYEVHEESLLRPLTDYACFKAECEKILSEYNFSDFSAVSIRPATVCGYSPRQRLDLIVNQFTNNAYHKREINIQGASRIRPCIHIEDITNIYCMLLEIPEEKIRGKVFNAAFENRSVVEMAEIVKEVIGDDVKLVISSGVDERSYRVSSKKIIQELGFIPKYTMGKAVEDLKCAFQQGKIPNPLTDARYYNKQMQKAYRWN